MRSAEVNDAEAVVGFFSKYKSICKECKEEIKGENLGGTWTTCQPCDKAFTCGPCFRQEKEEEIRSGHLGRCAECGQLTFGSKGKPAWLCVICTKVPTGSLTGDEINSILGEG